MYYCYNCGYKSVKWLGKCPLCEGWETFSEEKEIADKGVVVKESNPPRLLKDIKELSQPRVLTGMEEFDRLLGGGLVRGEVILLGGEPGVGKSTLLLEVCFRLSAKGKTLYVSAEESCEQVSLRARRLGDNFDNLYILGEDNLERVYDYIKEHNFEFVVIDSIQVVNSPQFEGLKGSAGQIRSSADYLTQIAKNRGTVIIMVGHVTKEGELAGPKLLEHIVDCVFYFEGEPLSNYRILRVSKNRFGATGELAIFEMLSSGLKEVKKTTELFLPHRNQPVAGSAVVCVIEGLRPILLELQALVSRASFGVVRRRSLGFDFNRFSLLTAIIEKRLKISLGSEDVFLNAAGGLKVFDPAADLGAVAAIVSSLKEKELPLNSVFIGEVGLAGELRKVSNINLRLKEVCRANFKRCFIPQSNLSEVDKNLSSAVESFSSLEELGEKLFS